MPETEQTQSTTPPAAPAQVPAPTTTTPPTPPATLATESVTTPTTAPAPPVEDGKKEDAEAIAPAPLTAADISIPEDFKALVNPELQTEFLSVMNNANLSRKELAQALTDLQAKAQREASEKGSQAWVDLQKSWRDAVVKEYGEAQVPALQARIGGLLDKYGDQEVRQAFDLTGAGNNPAIIRFINKIALAMGETAKPVAPGASNPGALGDRLSDEALGAALYPSMVKKA